MPTFNRILIFACQDIFEFPYALYDFFSLAFWVTMQREFVRESYMHSGLPLAVSNLFFLFLSIFVQFKKKNDSIFA